MSTTSSAAAGSAAPPRIPPPTGRREPLKANVFERMAGASCELQALFPYHDAGAIVPCGAIFTGDPDDGEFGHFFHWNTVEELTVVFGASGAMLQTGQIFANQALHGVNSFLRDPKDPDSYAVMTITQRQSDEDKQREAIIFRCQKCHEQLLRFEYDSTPQGVEGHKPEQWGGSHDDEYPVFSTIWGSVEAAAQMDDDAVRTCSKCGHVNDTFPEHKWGWSRWVEQTRTANRSKEALRTAIRALGEKKAVR
ncbi:hypothetical protein [Amycolatopsis thermoflava]|uniref:hypothetical protein n=2 Tax=Pseudonocardiaceae TaxID=2070 RepID=UPI003EB8E71B